VINGDSQTGVTIMRVVKELDAGSMFAKVTRPIGPDETSDVVESALADMGAELLLTIVEQLASGNAREEPQDETQATYASSIDQRGGADRLDSVRVRHSQPRPRSLSMATRVYLFQRNAANHSSFSGG
jgi:methionyl-tRNA formyltransferase